MNPITQGLLITAIGMGLVFVAILFLWALMDVLVRITNDKTAKEVTVNVEKISEEPDIVSDDKSKRLHHIASVAVVIAMSLQKQFPIITPQESGTISAWQSSRRSQVLNQSTDLINRKSRGPIK